MPDNYLFLHRLSREGLSKVTCKHRPDAGEMSEADAGEEHRQVWKSWWEEASLDGLQLAICFQNTVDQITALQEPLCNGSLTITEKIQSTYNAYRSLSHCYTWRSLGMHILDPTPSH